MASLPETIPDESGLKKAQGEQEKWRAAAQGGFALEVSMPSGAAPAGEQTLVVTTDVPGEEAIRVPLVPHKGG